MLYKLVYELTEVVTFKKGEVIFNDASYTEEGKIDYVEMKKVGRKKI